ncbi:hypothetical protein AX14_006250 [Amanita brunnescens Koide BX004]|nr:hypothetical protein AX14_006250 [Amanita brunnescens Koide BX004]
MQGKSTSKESNRDVLEKDARKKANAKTKVLHAVTRPKSIEFDDDALEAENSPANECHVQRPPQKVNIKQYYDAESEGDSGSENTDDKYNAGEDASEEAEESKEEEVQFDINNDDSCSGDLDTARGKKCSCKSHKDIEALRKTKPTSGSQKHKADEITDSIKKRKTNEEHRFDDEWNAMVKK